MKDSKAPVKQYVQPGDVIEAVGKGTEAGNHMGIAGRKIQVQVCKYPYPHSDELYPLVLSPHCPLTSPSMLEVAFYYDDAGWFFYPEMLPTAL